MTSNMKDQPTWRKEDRAEVRKATGLCVWDLEQLAVKLPTPEDFGTTILVLSKNWSDSFMKSLKEQVMKQLDEFVEGRAQYPTLLSIAQVGAVLEHREEQVARFDGLYDHLRKGVWKHQPRPRMSGRQWTKYQERLAFNRANEGRK